jgi:spermidine/putrescine transport system substrate-binding protein
VNPKTYKDFTKASGIKVRKDFYVSNEALQAKLKAGARGYDLAVPTGYMVQILAQDKLLQPIDWKKLPNVKKNIDPKFRRLPFDPKDQYSVAKDWGTTGFMYRTDLVKERPTTWREFVNLAKGKYSGKITVLDGIPEVIGSMLVMLGYSYNSDDRSELDKAKKELIALKPHLLAITSTEYKQLLESGKAVMSLGWNGDGLAVAAKKPAAYVVAKEGGEFWVDSYVIPKGARNPDAAHAWIDFVYQPKVNAQETAFTYYASPLRKTLLKGALAGAILNNKGVFPADGTVKKLEPNQVTPKGTALRNRIWTEFKAA